ncbi:rod shape-determining protein MreC [Shouchella shacheensis]|uniref:rod shape-determining protein MreC n=1 Tax=Shouchella shacheensis TaxID=1649580 RepID=UPI00073FE69B|nr:rod shape-determining protein MreC [Shouchella shacheensis]
MPSFFSNKKLIILLVSFIILVALIGYSMSERNVTGPERVTRDAVGWVQNVVSRPAHFVGGIYENVQEILNVYEENELLRSRLEEYAQVSVERNQLAADNANLLEMLDLEESLNDYSVLSSVVIHRSPDAWEQYVGLNRGGQDDVTEDMAVVDSQGGLVGKVTGVSEFTSYAQLLSDNDPTNRVSAEVTYEDDADQSVVGFIEGYDNDEGHLIMRKVDIDAEIEEGQMVTTSGLGDVYPAGLLIGEVAEVEMDEYGLSQNVYLEPVADFAALDYVYIVERDVAAMDPALLEEEDES